MLEDAHEMGVFRQCIDCRRMRSRPTSHGASVPLSAALSNSRLAAYGALGFPLAFAALPVYVVVPKLYGETLGLSLALVGAVLLFTRIADALIDPFVGVWSDARRSSFMFAGALLLAAGCLALFNPMAGVSLTVWLAGALVVTYTGFSLLSIPYQSWGAALTDDPTQTARVTAWREGAGLAGVVAAAALPSVLVGMGFSSRAAMGKLGWLAAVLVMLCLFISFRFAPQFGRVAGARNLAPSDSATKATQSTQSTDAPRTLAWWQPLQRDTFRSLLLVFAFSGIASAIPATLVLFFIADVLGLPNREGVFLATYFAVGAASLGGWVALARRIGKARAWLWAMGLSVAVFVWAATLGKGDFMGFLAISALSGIALGADLALAPALLADVIAREGDRGREGPYLGLWNFVTKANLALAAGLALPVLARLGYVPGAAGAGTNTAALTLIYCALPCVLKIIAAALLWHQCRKGRLT
jgi:glycoside/pentoside/hexuronide:cation symporter, GPH family